MLETIPGVNKVAAATFIAEMGVDMSVFNSSKHLASWAGSVQETTKVPVKKKTSKITHGNKALRTIAVECALATRQQNNRISAHRNRIMKRQGKKKAHIASAHLIIVIAYNILKLVNSSELGFDYVHNSEPQKEEKMINYLKRKGYSISAPDSESA
ncbi:IS110 family transposase [Anaerobacillus sp. HL2]|nr:IS110 family transposase [Anaerobacillus sp. HL2]